MMPFRKDWVSMSDVITFKIKLNLKFTILTLLCYFFLMGFNITFFWINLLTYQCFFMVSFNYWHLMAFLECVLHVKMFAFYDIRELHNGLEHMLAVVKINIRIKTSVLNLYYVINSGNKHILLERIEIFLFAIQVELHLV